jgi:release factor glutamine methyltransferase
MNTGPAADEGAAARAARAARAQRLAGVRSEAPEGPWTVLKLIRWSAGYLGEKGVERPRLDAEHLLAHALETSRLQLYLHYDRPLAPEELAAFKPLLLRRARREPLQYVLGRTGFRELELATDPRALIPRPETEVLVEVVLEGVRGRTGLRALDVGTGSGCIALSLALEGPFTRVVGVDASADALALARENAARTGIEVALRHGSLYDPLEAGEHFDVIASNPPYVARGEAGDLAPEIRDFEPGAALFAGPDGLDVLRPLVAGAPRHLAPEGVLALEVGASQTEAVAALVRATGAFDDVTVHRDLTGRPRIVAARRP